MAHVAVTIYPASRDRILTMPFSAHAPTIVQLGKYYPPRWGGVETVTRDLARSFVAQGWRSIVVAFDQHRESDVLDDVIVDRCGTFATIKSQPISLSWLPQAWRRIREADAVVVHTPNFLAALVLLLAPRRPTILFWHSDVVSKGLVGRLVQPLERLLLARADRIWVTSADYGTGSVALRGWQDKVEVMPLGIKDPLLADEGQPLPDPIVRFAAGRRLVIAVGRLVSYKGFDQLIRAFADVASEAALVIAGQGPQHDQLAALVAELGLTDRVILAGSLPQPELHALFRSASLYVMSSVGRTEAFGVVQIEAMAFSLPIVATDVPRSGVGWVSGHGALGALVPIEDPAALAAAIDAVFARDDLSILRERSRQQFEQCFPVDRMVRQAILSIAAVARLRADAPDPTLGMYRLRKG